MVCVVAGRLMLMRYVYMDQAIFDDGHPSAIATAQERKTYAYENFKKVVSICQRRWDEAGGRSLRRVCCTCCIR